VRLQMVGEMGMQTYLTPLEAARSYLQRGWMPLPVPFRSKNPGFEGWQKFAITEVELPQHFNGQRQNIGVLLGKASGDLADIDLDCNNAVMLAPYFLPTTGAIFGRQTRPQSHWLYVTPISNKVTFTDPVTGTRLLEILTNGQQAIFPGSTHKDTGELVQWYEEGEPAHVSAIDLVQAAKCLAAATLLAEHWPQEGTRQDAALALAGGLLRANFTGDETARFIEAVCEAAQDEETRSRVRTVVGTAAKLKTGAHVTGWPSLAKIVDKRIVDRVCDWLDIKINSHPEANDSAPPVAWPELPESALYGLAGEIVRTIDPHTEADRAAVLVQTLAAFGNCIGRTAHFKAEADRHYLNLFAVLVGSTSKGRKGTSWGQVRRLFERVDEQWVANCVGAGLSSGEGLIWSVRDPVEKKEPVKEKGRVVDYQTVIADEGVQDKRAFILEAEFASVLRVMGREGNTLSAIIRQAWDTGNLQVKTRNNPNRATGAHVTIIGHITKEELKRNLDETETANGFANRHLWVCVRRTRILPEGGSLSDAALNPLVTRLDEAFIFARGVSEMKRDMEARALWHQVYAELSEGHAGLFGAVTSRAEAQTMRLACLYALLDSKSVVERVHLEAALALWRYCEASARYIFGAATGDRIADELLSALQEASSDGLTRTQIRDIFNKRHTGAIDAALTVLSETGKARFEIEQTSGRPVTRWFATTRSDISDKRDKSTAQDDSEEGFVAYVAYVASESDEPEWVREHADEIRERAAIMEMDGGLLREEAERRAREWYEPPPF
jgi:uncharacterized protein DUF3987/bifunctional DNA primase/polymerase-like protein